jgi:hypothetical protein
MSVFVQLRGAPQGTIMLVRVVVFVAVIAVFAATALV